MSEDVRASDGADDLALDHYLRDIDTGKSPVAENTPAGDGEWGVLKVSAVQEGWFQSRENKVIRDAAHIQPRFEVRPGDLLMTRANTEALVGLACIAETPPPRLMLSDKTLRLVVDEGVADPAFVSLALLRPAVRNQVRAMATGTSAGMKNISQRQIRQLRVPRASLEQQRRIVAVHTAFERRIGVLEHLHEKLAAVARASLARELSAGRAHGVVPLKQLLEAVQSGWSPVCDSAPPAPDERGVLRLSAITSGTFVPEEAKRLPSGVVARAALEVAAGDVLVSRANGVKALVGVSCYVEEVRAGLYLPDLVFRLSPDPAHLDPKFLSLVLGSAEMRRQIDSVMRGTSGQYKISKADIRRLSVPAMPLSEQHRIAAVQRGFERRAGVIREQIAKLQVAQQGVVEALLLGKPCAQAA
ncbi:hypothetical protein [Streptomyces sp. NPDC087539]|uniref:hypothetical protein n=1 Tax=Streptomyces sp. NPDC087539 TaxID=3365798 RepID=UPI00380C8DEF